MSVRKTIGTTAFFAAVLLAFGCEHRTYLAVHYLPQITPGIHRTFPPLDVAVVVEHRAQESESLHVGDVIGFDGRIISRLFVRAPGRVLSEAMTGALREMGLRAHLLPHLPGARQHAPVGFFLLSDITELRVNKRFGQEITVHGRYFTMEAVARIAIRLLDSRQRTLLATVLEGRHSEPPQPVGHEVFLPLETEPAEALSIALSRAVESLARNDRFRRLLSTREN